jgi:hypothetical protein
MAGGGSEDGSEIAAVKAAGGAGEVLRPLAAGPPQPIDRPPD